MEEKVATSERYHIFILLMLSGGFMGAYSYYLKGGVFANAETANLLLLALNLANGNFQRVVQVLVPIATFFIGSFFSQLFIDRLKKKWPPILIACEMFLLSILSLLPQDAPFIIFHITIALISSMQYNTFQKSHGVVLSTLFCTAHLRGAGASLYNFLKEKDSLVARTTLYHIGLILTFILGAIVCAIASKAMGTHTLFLSLIPLFFVLWEMIRKYRND